MIEPMIGRSGLTPTETVLPERSASALFGGPIAELEVARLDNRLITAIAAPVNDNADPAAPIARRERLGGLLSYYYRAAA